MAPHDGFKFASARMAPMMPPSSIDYTRDTWSGGVVRRIKQMHMCGAELECDINWRAQQRSMHVSVANMLFLRGDGGTAGASPAKAAGRSPGSHVQVPQDDVWKVDCSSFAADDVAYAPWNPNPFEARRSYANFQRSYEKMGALLTNSQAVLPLLQRVVRCREKFEVRAYVHQYAAFDCGEPEFEEAFSTLEQVIANYSSLRP